MIVYSTIFHITTKDKIESLKINLPELPQGKEKTYEDFKSKANWNQSSVDAQRGYGKPVQSKSPVHETIYKEERKDRERPDGSSQNGVGGGALPRSWRNLPTS